MPRVGEQLADLIHKISTELDHPGAEALWIAVKRRKVTVSKKQGTEYVRRKSEKQVLGAPPTGCKEEPFRRMITDGRWI